VTLSQHGLGQDACVMLMTKMAQHEIS